MNSEFFSSEEEAYFKRRQTKAKDIVVDVPSEYDHTARYIYNIVKPCDECGIPDARYRKVTDEFLCTECRRLPKHHLITRSHALSKVIWPLFPELRYRQLKQLIFILQDEDLIRGYYIPNRRFPKQITHLFIEQDIYDVIAKLKEQPQELAKIVKKVIQSKEDN